MTRPLSEGSRGVRRITSLANPLVKEIRGLTLAKNRKASGLFVAEGLKLVADALEYDWTIRTLVHSHRVANETLVKRLSARAENVVVSVPGCTVIQRLAFTS